MRSCISSNVYALAGAMPEGLGAGSSFRRRVAVEKDLWTRRSDWLCCTYLATGRAMIECDGRIARDALRGRACSSERTTTRVLLKDAIVIARRDLSSDVLGSSSSVVAGCVAKVRAVDALDTRSSYQGIVTSCRVKHETDLHRLGCLFAGLRLNS